MEKTMPQRERSQLHMQREREVRERKAGEHAKRNTKTERVGKVEIDMLN